MKFNYQITTPSDIILNSGRRSGSIQNEIESPPENFDSIQVLGFRSENLICAGQNNIITNGRRCSIINGSGNSIGLDGIDLESKREGGKYNTHIIGGSNISNVSDNTFYIGQNLNILQSFRLQSDQGVEAIEGLYVFGSVIANGDVVAFTSSDKRIKNNIKSISNCMNKVKKINCVSFTWSHKKSALYRRDIGVIAQDVQIVQPEIVKERCDGYLAVDYKKIIPILIGAIKEKQERIDRLIRQVEYLKK